MIVKINALELASLLAHTATYDEQKDIVANEEDLFDGENYKEEHQDVFNRHYDFYFEMITNTAEEEPTDSCCITKVSTTDLEMIGYDTNNLPSGILETLASKLGNDYCEQLYWSSLPILADRLEIPKHKKVTLAKRSMEKAALFGIRYGTISTGPQKLDHNDKD